MNIRDAREELVTVIKVGGDELSTNCLKTLQTAQRRHLLRVQLQSKQLTRYSATQ